MRFGLLGSLEVVGDDGRPVDVGGSQPRHLLAMLLVASGRIVPVDALIEGVWGERPPGSAAGTLQSYVSRLRRTVEPGRSAGQDAKTLVWEPPGYRLNVDPGQVDFRRFERLAEEGRELLDAGSPDEARERLVEAVALWRGPALVEFADEEFARGMAARLEDRRLAAVEDRLAADLVLGRQAAVIGELTELVAAHPLREGLWGHLALALYRSGRQAEALRAIDEMRGTLRDELGVDPSRQIRELESAILAHDPALDRPDRPAPAARPAVPTDRAPMDHVVGAATRLVGRRPEVAEMRAMLAEALAGRSRLALIEGEAGIGKTRLLEQIGDDAVGLGAEVMWGRSFESGAAPTLWPWLHMLRTLLERDDTPPADREATEILARLLATSTGIGELPAVEGNRFVLLEAVARLLERTSHQRPLVILLDDLQWADGMSLELLEFLVGRVVGSRVFYAATLRDTDVSTNGTLIRALATLSSRPGSRRMALAGVDLADVPELVELATGEEAPAEVAAELHERAEGNPFYIGEMARLMAAREGFTPDAAHAAVPASVRDVIRGRLAHVPAETRDVLQVAAVIGRDVDFDLLARAADLDLGTTVDRVEPAVDTRLLEMSPSRPSTFRFSHALIREVVLDEISPLRRARLHLRVADAMEATGAGDDEAEILADHLWSAIPLGVGPRAASALERAADVAARRYAHQHAESLLERAIELREVMSPPDDEAELLARYKLAAVRRRRVGYLAAPESAELERAQQLAARTGRDDLLVDLLWDTFASASTSCDYPVAKEMAGRLVRLGESTLDPAIEAAGHGAWGVNHLQLGEIRLAAERLDRAEALTRDLEPGKGPLGMTEHLVLTTCYAAMVHSIADDADHDSAARLDALSTRQGEPYQRLIVGSFAALSATLAGDSARAEQVARAGLEAIPPESFPFFAAATEILLGAALVERGVFDEGLAYIDSGGHRYRNPWVRTIVPYYVSLRAVSFARAGRHERALADIAAAHRLLAESGERWPQPFVLLDEAEIRHRAGSDPGEVVELLTGARTVAVEQGALAGVRRAAELAERLGVVLDD